jgi:hypothetical protein
MTPLRMGVFWGEPTMVLATLAIYASINVLVLRESKHALPGHCMHKII